MIIKGVYIEEDTLAMNKDLLDLIAEMFEVIHRAKGWDTILTVKILIHFKQVYINIVPGNSEDEHGIYSYGIFNVNLNNGYYNFISQLLKKDYDIYNEKIYINHIIKSEVFELFCNLDEEDFEMWVRLQ